MAQQLQGTHDTYVVGEKLGEGGFGETFLATQSDQSVVVIKRLLVKRLDDWKALELFERESAVLSTLEHPNIPRYVDAFEDPDGGGLVLVQEFIEGRTLRHVLRDGAELDEALMTRWFIKILEVFAYLHALDPPVIHRDVNPNNIILRTSDSEPFLIDFGTVQAAIRSESTVSSTAAGTFGYAPTEQFIGKAYPSSDLYGLAMTFLAVWSGTEPEAMPFASGAVQLDELLGSRPLDGRLKLTLERMIDRVPENRPASAEEVLDRLSALRAVRASTPAAAAERLAVDPSTNPWLQARARLQRIEPDALLGDVSIEHESSRYLENWAISSDNATMLLTTDGSGQVTDTASMTVSMSLRGNDSNDALGFAPDTSFIIAFNGWREHMKRFDLTAGGKAETFDIATELQSSNYGGPDAPIAISPDHKLAAVGSPLALFSPESGALIRITDVRSEAPPCFSPDGRTLVGVGDAKIALMATDGSRKDIDGTCFAFSHDGRRAAVATQSGSCAVQVGEWTKLANEESNWFEQSWELLDTEGGEVRHLCFDPTGRWLAVGVCVKHTKPNDNDWHWANRVLVIDTATDELVSEFGDPSRSGHAIDDLYHLGFDAGSERLFVFMDCFITVHDRDDRHVLLVHDFKRGRHLGFIDGHGIRTAEGFFAPLPQTEPKASSSDPFENFAWRVVCGRAAEAALDPVDRDRLLDLRQRIEFVRGLFAGVRDGGVALPPESDVRPLLEATRGLTHLLPWIKDEAVREAAALPAFGASWDEEPPVRVEHLVSAAEALAARGEAEREALFEEMLEDQEREAAAARALAQESLQQRALVAREEGALQPAARGNYVVWVALVVLGIFVAIFAVML